MIEENERATDETDDAPSLKPWSKPRIKTLYIIGTKTGTKTHVAVDEDFAIGFPDDPRINYTPRS